MKDGGYFKQHRSEIRGVDPLWSEPRVWSRAEAWMYVRAVAEPGQSNKLMFSASLRDLAAKWSWTRSKVRRFMDSLEAAGRLSRDTQRDTNRDTKRDIYVVASDGTYQLARDTSRDTQRDTPPSSPPHTPPLTPTPPFRREEEGIAARLEDKPAQQHALLTFPCIGKPGEPREWGLTAEYVAELGEAYAGLDVLAECRRALAWVRANRPKTAKGMRRFVTGWLDKAAQRAPGPTLFPTNGPTRIPARRADKSEPSSTNVRIPQGWK